MHKKVYFILVHKNLNQVKDLINLLDDKKSLFFIHVDKKVSIEPYYKLLEKSSCILIKNRVKCSWGKYSLVQATVNAMSEIQNFMSSNFKNFDYHLIMLSGEDLPLNSNEYIDNFLKQSRSTSFVNYWSLPYEKWWNGGLFRLENIYLFEYKKNKKLNYWVNRLIKKCHLHFLLPINRFNKKFPKFTLYGSSQWMILSKNLVEFVLEQNKKNTKFNAVFKYVLAPDEIYFLTLIMNYRNKNQFEIKNFPTHLVVFEGLEASPKYLQLEDVSDGIDEFLFARKFDPKINQNTIEVIKNTIRQ
jgi:hypothetical protein